MNVDQPNQPISDELGERIVAYLDGELTAPEATEVERLLADNPAAQRLADDFRGVSRACSESPEPVFTRDLSSSVVAEALRRQAAGEGTVEPVDRLEPDGDFGLPFGKASRNWAWAVVAAAAAVMIAFNGPSDSTSPTGASPQGGQVAVQLPQHLRAMQRAAPGVQVVNFQATPDMVARLRQRLALQSAQRAQLPGELMEVSQKGVVVEPADTALSPESDEQLLYLDADEAELDRLLNELNQEEEGALVPVEPDAPQRQAAKPAPSPGIRAVPLRVKVSPEQLASLLQQQQQAAPEGQRRIVVLRIQLKPRP